MRFPTAKTLLAIAVGIATTTAFCGPRADNAGCPDSHLARIAERLNLTPEQQTQVKAIVADERLAAERLHEDTRKRIDGVLTDAQRAEQNAAMQKRMGQHLDRLAKQLDLSVEQTARIGAIFEEQRDQPGLNRTAVKERIAAVLSPEQKQQFESMGPRDERHGKKDCESGHDDRRDGPMDGPDDDLTDEPDSDGPDRR